MKGLSDTSPEAERVLIECYRRMSPARKWHLLGDAYRYARVLHEAGLRQRTPGASEEDVRRDWMARTLGPGPWLERWEPRMLSQPLEHQLVIEEVYDIFRQVGIACAIGGSLASSVHGKTRYTEDADMTAEPFPGREAAFAAKFGADYYVSLPAIRDAVRNRSTFNLIHMPTGFKVDVFIRKDRAFDHSLLRRRVPTPNLGSKGRPYDVVSPEDIILLKLEWYRLGGEISDRQWEDLIGVMKVQAGRLDGGYLDQWAADLGVTDLLQRARQESAIP
jgi:hypothetical protein